MGGRCCRWALLLALPRPSSSSPSCPSPAISSISPVSSIRIASSSSIHAVRVESRCCGGIASSWLWVFYGSWGVINVSEGERKEKKRPHRLPLLRVVSSLLSSIHLLPCRGVLLRRCGVLIRRREVLPCRCRVLSHRRGVLCLVIVGDLLGHVEAGGGHHSMWFAWLGWEFKLLVVRYVGFGKKMVIGVA